MLASFILKISSAKKRWEGFTTCLQYRGLMSPCTAILFRQIPRSGYLDLSQSLCLKLKGMRFLISKSLAEVEILRLEFNVSKPLAHSIPCCQGVYSLSSSATALAA
ncbi:hypothetical protein NE237_019756 [Protea cynaroides]|uniref:Uncharacterized protein n=1 Tax=Protea cynaroides TaxID=273540 RepID=A0A9Q0H751_9MAGN|nr:hypothetical protein NE237_019756 [Protea cynaroides]